MVEKVHPEFFQPRTAPRAQREDLCASHRESCLLNTAPWPHDARTAIALQRQLRTQVVTEDRHQTPCCNAGVDVGYAGRAATHARAAIAVLSYPELALIDSQIAESPVSFPYVPGLLSFRELPVVLAAFAQHGTLPDMIFCDGQGYAHPRRFGIACHLGLLLDLPTIGVAKSRLIGTHAPVPDRRGAWVALYDAGEVIGAVLRTRIGVQPLYVSIGHRVSLPRAVARVMACTGRFRLPETTRHAHCLASGPRLRPAHSGLS